jgi:hypothetical protein
MNFGAEISLFLREMLSARFRLLSQAYPSCLSKLYFSMIPWVRSYSERLEIEGMKANPIEDLSEKKWR